MLIQLSIENVAVIEKLDIEFDSGMTVLTGETGAGKSIIIDSINMILGERTNRELVRSGETKAKVQAVFYISGNLVHDISGDVGEIEENQLVISREVTADGKSICRVNGNIVTLTYLRELGSRLINIHGQHDNQALLNPKKHILFTDGYAKLSAELEKYRSEYNNYKTLVKRIDSLSQSESERIKNLDLLNYQYEEIEKAKLVSGEEECLKKQRNIISNAEAITDAAETAYESLYNSSSGSAYDALSSAVKSLGAISDYNGVSEIVQSLTDALYTVEECAHDVKALTDGVEYDEAMLNDIEARLDVISSMKRKYGRTVEDVLKYYEEISEKRAELENTDELLSTLGEELNKSRTKLQSLSDGLSELRKKSAHVLEAQIKKSLADLNMQNCRFEIRFERTPDFTLNGRDIAEFYISTNEGEELKPLDSVASGGELSRVMLAMKAVLADSDNVDTLIFDEIDTGVSGKSAQKIALKLMQISASKQVICITHTAQIAALADNHFYISKTVAEGRTKTGLKKLSPEERIREIAGITDGEITEASVAHAREMLERKNS